MLLWMKNHEYPAQTSYSLLVRHGVPVRCSKVAGRALFAGMHGCHGDAFPGNRSGNAKAGI